MLKNLQRYWLVYLALVVLATTGALRLMEQPVAAQWLASIFIVAVILWVGAGMIRDLLRGHTGLDILAVVSMTATLLVGEYVAGLIIVIMIIVIVIVVTIMVIVMIIIVIIVISRTFAVFRNNATLFFIFFWFIRF